MAGTVLLIKTNLKQWSNLEGHTALSSTLLSKHISAIHPEYLAAKTLSMAYVSFQS